MQDSTAKRWRTYTHPCVRSPKRGEELPEPNQDRQMFSFTTYNDG